MQKTLLASLLVMCVAGQASAQMMDQPPPGYSQPGYQAPSYPPPQAQYQQPPQPEYQQPMYGSPPPAPAQQFCQPYRDKFAIGGEVRITSGTACLRPDGSWDLHPQQLGMRYVANGNGLIFVPVHPFAAGIDFYHHHHHY